jgi:hypothetical protein
LFRIKNGAIDLSLPKLKKDIMNDTTAGNYWLLKKINELETNKKG